MQGKQTRVEFSNPSTASRSLPFWSWNAKLEPEEIRQQIREMKEKGIGGFFMHSREGLETPYLSKEWMEAVSAAVEEAKQQGMEAWIYDEDRWPSGFAGGQLGEKYGEEVYCKGLTLELLEEGDTFWQQDESILARYQGKTKEMELADLTRLEDGLSPDEGMTHMVFRLETSGKADWFNGHAPPDTLSPMVLEYFIQHTHEQYRKVVGEDFGTTVKGVFTDEPSVNDRHASFGENKAWIPWTHGFREFFIERRGYDPFDTLPYLYFNTPESAAIRHDYWWTLTQRFTEVFSGALGAWCKEQGIAYTGHFLQEHQLGLATRVSGAIMPHYVYQDVPGVDLLQEQTDEYLTMKQCTSVAHQYRKPMVLSEAYGCTGWDFTFEGQKWMGDWQYVLGVNRMSKHLSFYSIRGCRKRDYPPSFHYNTTWWQQNKVIEDYFARLSAVLLADTAVRDILVLHPSTTAWSRLGCNPYGNPTRRSERDVPAIDAYGQEFNKLLKNLSHMHWDYDLGDEMLLSKDGKVKENTLTVKYANYQTVILPPVDTLLESTVELLEKFLKASGKIFAMTPTPTLLQGRDGKQRLEKLFSHPNVTRVQTFAQLNSALEKQGQRQVSLTGETGQQSEDLLYLLQKEGKELTLFVVNNNRTKEVDTNIFLSYLPTGYRLEQWDALTGEQTILPLVTEKMVGSYFSATLEPSGSALYRLIPEEKKTRAKKSSAQKQLELAYAYSPECAVTLDYPNALPLDSCSYSWDGKTWAEPMELWEAQKEVRTALSMRDISRGGILQRYLWIYDSHPKDDTPLYLRFVWESKQSLSGLSLALEERERLSLSLNGTPVDSTATGWYLDKDIETIALPTCQQGENILEVFCRYQDSMELENMYLLGDFSVDNHRRLGDSDLLLRTGDWTLQGFPFYAGNVSYEFSLREATLDFSKDIYLNVPTYQGTTMTVSIGKNSHSIPWNTSVPLPLSSILQEGEETLTLVVYGSPRNILGPFHLAEGRPYNTNDSAFTPTGIRQIDGYHVTPYGLKEPPRLYYGEDV